MHDGSHGRFIVRNCFDGDLTLAVAWSGEDIVRTEFAHHRGEIIAELSAGNREFADVAESWLVAAISSPFDERLEFLGNQIKRCDLRRRHRLLGQ